MKRLQQLKSELKELGGNILLSCTPGYDSLFEEFSKGVWRINLLVEMDSMPLEKFIRIKEIAKDVFSDYNLIVSAHRNRTLEYWTGQFGAKNLLLHICPVSHTVTWKSSLWEVPLLLSKQIVSGEDFTRRILLDTYNWKDFEDVLGYSYVPAYLFLKEDLCDEFRLGMLKSYFLRTIAAALYSKGRMPSNREKIVGFFEEKFSDKKMMQIIKNFYENKYDNIDEGVKDTLYFMDKLYHWPGLNLIDACQK